MVMQVGSVKAFLRQLLQLSRRPIKPIVEFADPIAEAEVGACG